VVEATQNYLLGEDAVGRFMAERCERHSAAHAELKDLYAEWKKFSAASGEADMSQKSFSQKLEGQNLVKGNDSRSRRVIFHGIRLRPNDDKPEVGLSPPDADALRW
jgi:putative DNA primase/helicase